MTEDKPQPLLGERDGLARLIGADEQFIGRMRFYPLSTPAAVEGIRFGIVFVVAWWSIPALRCWSELKRHLTQLDPEGRLEIAVLDIDGMSGFEPTALGPTVAGAGETAWVRDGRSVLPGWTLGGGDVIRVNTRLFLDGRKLFVPNYISARGNAP